MKKAVKIRKPRTDDKLPWNIQFAVWGTPAVFVAHQLKLFPLLAEKPRSLEEICAAKGLKRRPAEAILSLTTSLGVTRFRGGRYSLTPAGEDYFIETSPTYFGASFDNTIGQYSLYSIESLKRAVMSDSAQVYGGGEVFKAHDEHPELARNFTRMMHSSSMGPASGWPGKINLAKHRVMLDVAGGSGAHSIGAVARWPKLRAVVLDSSPVCDVAAEIVSDYGLQERIGTQRGDMWKDPFPSADVHFYSMIFHDWQAEKCKVLARKSFDALDSGGRIIVHEMLFNRERTGPFPVAAFNVTMLLWTEGEQYSGREISSMLRGETDVWVLEHRHRSEAMKVACDSERRRIALRRSQTFDLIAELPRGENIVLQEDETRVEGHYPRVGLSYAAPMEWSTSTANRKT